MDFHETAGRSPAVRSIQIFTQEFQKFFRPPAYQQDEWLALGGLTKKDKTLRFTSMERIRLLRHIIEAPEIEGGCGLGSLDELCMRGIFTAVVPVHDSLRTGEGLDGPRNLEDMSALARMRAALRKYKQRSTVASVGGDEGRRLLRMPVSGLHGAVRDAAAVLWGRKPQGTLMRSWGHSAWPDFLSWGYWLPSQPLDEIRDYLGEEVALYFAFIQSLTRALLVPAGFGILPTLWAVRVGSMDNPFTDLHALVCLLWTFGFAKYWRRRSNQLAFEWHVETHEYDEIERLRPEFVAGARRGDVRAGQQYTSSESLEEESLGVVEPLLPDCQPGLYSPEGYYVPVNEQRVPVATSTQGRPAREPRLISTFDRTRRSRRIALSWSIVLMLILVAVLVTELLMILRTFLMGYFHSQPASYFAELPVADLVFQYRVYVGAGIAACANTLWITASNAAFASLATWLTDWENHMTHNQHANMLIYKQFTFQFMNSYASLFYIAFVKGQTRTTNEVEGQYITSLFPFAQRLLEKYTSEPYDYCHDPANFSAAPADISANFIAHLGETQRQHLGIAPETLLNPFCMAEVTTQLGFLVVLRQVLDLAFEYYWPRLIWLLQWTMRRQADHVTRKRMGLERSKTLPSFDDIHREGFYRAQVEKPEWRGVLLEYMELVIQIGYIVLFAPAFPLAALVVYAATAIKIKNDAFKLLRLYQRPFPRIVNSIGTWETVIQVLGVLAVGTNTALVLVTATNFLKEIPFTLPLVRVTVNSGNYLLFFVAIEHIVLGLQFSTMYFLLDLEAGTAKQRTRALWEESKLFARLRQEQHHAYAPIALDSIGPFATPRVQHEQMGFETASIAGHYTVDLQREINQLVPQNLAELEEPGYPPPQQHGDQGPHSVGGLPMYNCRVAGPLSGLSAITLPLSKWAAAGIPPEAEYFAFACTKTAIGPWLCMPPALLYWPMPELTDEPFCPALADPLTSLSHLDDYHLSLLIRLFEQPPADERAQERALAMRFLVTGGYVYFSYSGGAGMRVVRANAIQPAAQGRAGLHFRCFTTHELPFLARLRGFLDSSGRYRLPTLPSLRQAGITGISWVRPGEQFPRGPHDQTAPEEAWPSGGFAYRYSDPAFDRIFVVCGASDANPHEAPGPPPPVQVALASAPVAPPPAPDVPPAASAMPLWASTELHLLAPEPSALPLGPAPPTIQTFTSAKATALNVGMVDLGSEQLYQARLSELEHELSRLDVAISQAKTAAGVAPASAEAIAIKADADARAARAAADVARKAELAAVESSAIRQGASAPSQDGGALASKAASLAQSMASSLSHNSSFRRPSARDRWAAAKRALGQKQRREAAGGGAAKGGSDGIDENGQAVVPGRRGLRSSPPSRRAVHIPHEGVPQPSVPQLPPLPDGWWPAQNNDGIPYYYSEDGQVVWEIPGWDDHEQQRRRQQRQRHQQHQHWGQQQRPAVLPPLDGHDQIQQAATMEWIEAARKAGACAV